MQLRYFKNAGAPAAREKNGVLVSGGNDNSVVDFRDSLCHSALFEAQYANGARRLAYRRAYFLCRKSRFEAVFVWQNIREIFYAYTLVRRICAGAEIVCAEDLNVVSPLYKGVCQGSDCHFNAAVAHMQRRYVYFFHLVLRDY